MTPLNPPTSSSIQPASRRISSRQLLQWGILLAAILGSAAMFVAFFERLPIEGTSFLIDFRAFWQAVQHGDVVYAPTNGLRVPPWSVLFIMPLGIVSLRTAWGLLVFVSVGCLVASVPRVRPMWKHLLSVLLLVASFLTLRVMVDGNFEGLMVGGLVLILYGYRKRNPWLLAVGLLLATFKPQAVFLLIGGLGLYLIYKREWRFIAITAALTLAVLVPAMLWRGADWLVALGGENFTAYTGNYLDISLGAAVRRTEVIPPLIGTIGQGLLVVATLALLWITRHSTHLLSREKAGVLIAASLLVAPYAAGNSVLTVLAIGVIPLFQKRLLPGLLLILLSDAVFMIHRPEFVPYVSYYWTVYLLLTWSLLAWYVYREERRD